MVNKKYNNLEFYRIMFTVLVCVHHMRTYSFIKHGYLAVEFFFIISGFMLYKTYKSKNLSPKEYFLGRLKKLYPQYLFGLIVVTLYLGVIFYLRQDFSSIKDLILQSISEPFLVQRLGIWPNGNNYPLWYLAVLVWGGILLYSLLYKKEYFVTHIFAPVFILGYYSYHCAHYQTIEAWEV